MQAVKRIGGLVILVGALATMGGCVHISQRALTNGRMVSNYGYGSGQSYVYGQHNFTTQRELYGRLDIRHAYSQPRPYPYFGHW